MKNTQDTLLGFVLNLFVSLPEPRRRHCRVYPLEMLLFCAMATFITGRRSFYDMNAFAEVYKDLLIELFGVSSTPSHDTFARIFRILDKKLFALCLQKFSEKIGDIMDRHVVAIDGKTCRRARDAARKAAHIISAWSPGEKLTPGVCMVGEKSNEIPAVPELLDLLGATLKGTVVTAGAFNTQKATAAAIIAKGADYVLAVKDNQPELSKAVSFFLDHFADTAAPMWSSTEKGHGRLEVRSCWQSEDVKWILTFKEWKGLKSICVVQRTSTKLTTGETTTSRRYFISSLPLGPQEIARCVREHWDVENSCHWSLDVIFNEECCLARAGNEAANLRTLRSIVMNYLTDAGKRLGATDTRMRMMTKAGMSTKYLYSVLGYKPTEV